MTRGRWIVIVLVAAFVSVVAIEIATSGSGSSAGQKAPRLPTQVLSPPQVALADLRGKPAFINFWASWCDPCREEAPVLERFATALHGRGTLVGVDWNDSLSGARQFIEQYRLTYPILRDATGAVGDAYRLSGLPTTYVLDSGGRIIERLRGPQTDSSLHAALTAVASAR
jgi:cytochrome c biogenesis protein CcmG, thiol:disulfide interchange protein DsbE